MSLTVPASIPEGAEMSVQERTRHPNLRTTVSFITIKARWRDPANNRWDGCDFGRWTPRDPSRSAEWAVAVAQAKLALVTARLDLKTRNQTAFATFDELLDARYTPTLSDKGLADAYDLAQSRLGNDRRAVRRSPRAHDRRGTWDAALVRDTALPSESTRV